MKKYVTTLTDVQTDEKELEEMAEVKEVCIGQKIGRLIQNN